MLDILVLIKNCVDCKYIKIIIMFNIITGGYLQIIRRNDARK